MMFSPYELRQSMRLYAVTDNAWLDGRSLTECVAQALEGGATFVQLRDKHATTQQMVAQAKELIPLCHAARVPFVINDDVEAALLSGADGVHVGQDDMACAAAREALGPDAIVGVSVQTVEQALEAVAAGASYLGVGAMIPTPTKPDAVDVTWEELAALVAAVDIPVVAIGGLNASTVDQLAGSGVDGAAVVSAVFAAKDIPAATACLKDKVNAALPVVLPSVLSIAGSDSSGGAGIQADIKTIASLGVFAQTAITALTAQNTQGVTGVLDVDPAFVEQQIDTVFADIRPQAVKIGMVSSPAIVSAIVSALGRNGAQQLVVDPVLVATSGAALGSGGVVEALKQQLFPLATVITPNLSEAEALCGFAIQTAEDAQRAAECLRQWCPGAILVKGGHGLAAPSRSAVVAPGGGAAADGSAAVGLAADDASAGSAAVSGSAAGSAAVSGSVADGLAAGSVAVIGSAADSAVVDDSAAGTRIHGTVFADDLLMLPDGTFVWLEGERIDNPNAHGTGCTLSSAIASGLAQGLPVEQAVRRAKGYITSALRAQLNLGKGSGPLNHMWRYW